MPGTWPEDQGWFVRPPMECEFQSVVKRPRRHSIATRAIYSRKVGALIQESIAPAVCSLLGPLIKARVLCIRCDIPFRHCPCGSGRSHPFAQVATTRSGIPDHALSPTGDRSGWPDDRVRRVRKSYFTLFRCFALRIGIKFSSIRTLKSDGSTDIRYQLQPLRPRVWKWLLVWTYPDKMMCRPIRDGILLHPGQEVRIVLVVDDYVPSSRICSQVASRYYTRCLFAMLLHEKDHSTSSPVVRSDR